VICDYLDANYPNPTLANSKFDEERVKNAVEATKDLFPCMAKLLKVQKVLPNYHGNDLL